MDKKEALKIVKKYGPDLENLPDHFKKDKKIVLNAVKEFGFSIECKNCERLNVWDAYDQACANSGDYEPLLIMKKNRKKPLVVLDAEAFIKLMTK